MISNYGNTGPVVDVFTSTNTGQRMEQLNPQGVMSFKSNIEQHVQYMSGYINSIEMRVRAMEHNHADMTKFYQWLEQTHPDIINAYKSVTTVNKRFDDADKKEEMIYPQTASAA